MVSAKVIKKFFFRAFLFVEVILFIYFYFFGVAGLNTRKNLNLENVKLDEKISVLKKEVEHLSSKLEDLNKYDYYKEKIARQNLQMAKKDEIIYFLK